MKKMMKKTAVIMVSMMVVTMLAACSKFDGSAYLKAILDNSYYNDSTGIVEQQLGTAEEAAALYEQGIDAEMQAMLVGTSISDELHNEYRDFYKDLFSKVKYTVGEATEIDESTIEVSVTYEQLNVFEAALSSYETRVLELVEEWTTAAAAGEEVPTEEQMNDQIFCALKDCLVEELAKESYSEPVTATVRLELIDNLWTPNTEDLTNLEYVLFDLAAIYEM